MSQAPTRLHYLLQQYAADSCTRRELLELLQTIRDAGDNQDMADSLRSIWLELTGSATLPVIDKERVFSDIISAPEFRDSVKRRLWPRRMAVAATFLLVMGTCGYLYLTLKPPQKMARTPARSKNDVSPGGNKAILTLADGSTIVLDSSHNGALGTQGNTRLIKQDSGQLVYKAMSAPDPALANAGPASPNGSPTVSTQYNTISIPRGGQYQVVLPDGTKVWLNASTTLRFPIVFNGPERYVDLAGEAYFEVAKEKTAFKVRIYSSKAGLTSGKGQKPASEIEVLGTHFNVNAYEDDADMQTTLLEGSIRLSNGAEHLLLKPGQQAISTRSGAATRVISDADTDAAIAWKNGYFQFDGVGIETVMRQLARWYDVDVQYEGAITERQFGGQMPRGVNLSEVLRILEESNVHFRIEGKKLVVTP